eukprot:6452379-Lingulodinium_polyedra.AAC.1
MAKVQASRDQLSQLAIALRQEVGASACSPQPPRPAPQDLLVHVAQVLHNLARAHGSGWALEYQQR